LRACANYLEDKSTPTQSLSVKVLSLEAFHPVLSLWTSLQQDFTMGARQLWNGKPECWKTYFISSSSRLKKHLR
jgi:hypothetical protein